MTITIEIDIRRISICLSSKGLHRRLIFNDMDDSQALQLLPQYGYRPDQVYDIRHEVHTHRRQLSDAAVHELLEQYCTNCPETDSLWFDDHPMDGPGFTIPRPAASRPQQALLAAVRQVIPNASRILYHQ